jgi:hypothetical protein
MKVCEKREYHVSVALSNSDSRTIIHGPGGLVIGRELSWTTEWRFPKRVLQNKKTRHAQCLHRILIYMRLLYNMVLSSQPTLAG